MTTPIESPSSPESINRREALAKGGRIAGASALAGVAIPHVHAADDLTRKLALVGCGGRGTGAALNALSQSAELGPVKLVAMADVFEDRLEASHRAISSKDPGNTKVDVPAERKFLGFDAYKKAIDVLSPGDIAICATPPAFRWLFFEYAIDKGVHVFMEKPVSVDGPSTKKIFELSAKADEKNLKVGIGLMCRHCEARGELAERIHGGEIGDIHLLRAYRMQGPIASSFSPPKPDSDMTDLEYQIRRFHSFLWLSGGSFSDFFIHNIDEACWMKDAFPVSAQAIGGRHYREDDAIDQNFDSYSVEYTFEDGAKFFLGGRNMLGVHKEFATYVHGTKGSAVCSTSSHSPAHPRIFSDQNIEYNHRKPSDNLVWSWNGGDRSKREPNPYELEWADLLLAIRDDLPYNEALRGGEASLATAMGRMAAHTGQVITRDMILAEGMEMAPNLRDLTYEAKPPVEPDENGVYPVPEPGRKKLMEY